MTGRCRRFLTAAFADIVDSEKNPRCLVNPRLILVGLALALGLAGCVSKSKARLQAQAAFLAGQQQAMQHSQEVQNRGPVVTVLGQVRDSVLPWTAGLTLAKAIVAAGYYGAGDPAEIVIVRENQEIPVDPKSLLNGEDVPLLPRDVVELKQSRR
jgi:hypothetical protein